MSEFSHSLHVFGVERDALSSCLRSLDKQCAIVESNAVAATIVADWESAQPLSAAVGTVLEYSFAEDHGFDLRVWHDGELESAYGCPFGEQLDMPVPETPPTREFHSVLVKRLALPEDRATAALASLEQLDQVLTTANEPFDEANIGREERLVSELASCLRLPMCSWLSEDYVFSNLDEAKKTYPALQVFPE